MGLLTKIFGDSHAREVKKLWRYVEEVNSYENRMADLKDEEFSRYTARLKDKLTEEGESLDDILPEAFALAREAARRTLGLRPFDVQVLGGVVLHQGRIAEMKTGEGKTLVATMPAYLNALTGLGVHIVTVNDYLARRDRDWMGPVFEFLGLTVGVITHDMKPEDRRAGYHADITYGTNNEFGFDYLRDNMVLYKEKLVQKEHHFAVIDEVDSILIDEARTPLIISGMPQKETGVFERWKEPVESIIKKQKRQVNDLLKKVREKSEAGLHEEAAELLYLARLGAPKNSELMEILKESSIAKKVDQAKHNLSKTQEHMLREQLYFTIDEATGVVDISSQSYEILAEEEPTLKKFLSFDREEQEEEADDFLEEADTESDSAKELQEIRERGGEHESIIRTMLKAYSLFEKDVDYVVADGEVVIVDEFTGRLMHGRRYSEGLHQAIEAKEGVTVKGRSQTIASITFQNYFRRYQKLSGMTGTALTEESEFRNIYGMDVVAVPTNKPLQRTELPDAIYRTEQAKFRAVVEEIEERHSKGQPVLVGTISIEKSELLSKMLKQRGIPHHVLNAKNHEKEAEIISQAGQKGAVTISTNMAGRGTDIILGGNPEPELRKIFEDEELAEDQKGIKIQEVRQRWQERHDEVVDLGGLHILGTERHESRRIDNQLRGRAGRQGDPGSSQFFISLEDDLMRIFGSDSVSTIMEKMGMEEDAPLEHSMVSKVIQNAQKKVEGRYFEMRKHVLEYDDVINNQRDVIYSQRRQVLEGENLRERVLGMISDLIEKEVLFHAHDGLEDEEWNLAGLLQHGESVFLPPGRLTKDELRDLSREEIKEALQQVAYQYYEEREKELGSEIMRELERVVLLRTVDRKWMEQIDNMHELRQGVGLRAIGQQDPLQAYRKEAYEMFQDMIHSIQEEVVRLIFRVQVTDKPQREQVAVPQQAGREQVAAGAAVGTGTTSEASSSGRKKQQPVRVEKKVGRNEPCPCGSGKKHKKCCGITQ